MDYPTLEGFYMPPEWQAHEACWMAWPCRIELWRERYDNACAAFAEIARKIGEVEPVKVLAPAGEGKAVQLQLGHNVEVLELELDDSWLRDNGPTFLTDGQGESAGISWHFNGWGNKFHNYQSDEAAADWVLDHLGLRRFDGAMVLEGGAIDVDGAGRLLTTETAVLNANRNPTLDRQQIEERLAMFLGVRRVIWLPSGLADDVTDGHVDKVARFIAPGHILYGEAVGDTDKNRNVLAKNYEYLSEYAQADGDALEFTSLPMPLPIQIEEGRQLAISYLNFYIANNTVFVPAFGSDTDDRAHGILRELFMNREIVALDASELMHGGGIHSLTQQQPASVSFGSPDEFAHESD